MIPPRRNVVIRTERLVIKPPMRGDYESWRNVRNASRQHLIPWEPTWSNDALSPDDWQRHLRGWKEAWKIDHAYAFFLWSGINLVGGMTFSNVRRGPAQMTNLGYWQGVMHVGNGYMREAVRAGCQWMFTIGGVERIEAGTLIANDRSQAVLKAAGFTQEGVARQYLQINGVRHDHVMFGLVRGDNTV